MAANDHRWKKVTHSSQTVNHHRLIPMTKHCTEAHHIGIVNYQKTIKPKRPPPPNLKDITAQTLRRPSVSSSSSRLALLAGAGSSTRRNTGLGGGENRDDNLSICVEERGEICVSTNRKNYSEPLEILHVTGSVSNSSFIVCE